ncbi:HlyD family efflux transporter periplasmic adaptor subunit [Bacteroidales bacterium OttesenSCG-928-B11]|nr:HlyD family efflux transporter periplasmic adaptor subunit [Bacteroidales bacterium OttesenSCG-928-E04]MDL2307964.1 HlyD family efflux transporter periplasmic adaptor subunit [Bacteroidales bacterium OttesenSCG-928-C03]MDL2311675.1 HlyD family efflux transporter periplasmic adaptor subunit [Bacteroidales bacterium OttesenSCG-928-B11]MDL2325754.1 HlyD family efflux transporter periplasmic adaptor subunit [Bacteroidales bacterium OttesenSCG-928-A14]
MDKEIPKAVQQRQKVMRGARYVMGIVLVIGAIIVLLGLLRSRLVEKSLTIGTVDSGVLEVTVSASGKVIPLVESVIVSPISTKIVEVYRNAGDLVKTGDPILKLDLTSLESNFAQKLDELEMRKSRLEQLRVNQENTLSELEMQLVVKEMMLKQLENDWRNELYLDSLGASTTEKTRQLKLNLEISKLELEQLKQRIDNQKSNAAAELKVQELDLNIFRKTLEESERLLKESRVLSPQNATLTFVNQEIGTQIGPGTRIATLSDLSSFKVHADIAVGYADKVSVSEKVTVVIGKTQLEGVISNVTPSVNNGLISFVITLNNPEHRSLRAGLRADVYVHWGVKEQVLRLPHHTFYIGKGEYELWVIRGDKAIKQKVMLGECGFDYVEVMDGLKLNDRVILNDMSSFRNKRELKVK